MGSIAHTVEQAIEQARETAELGAFIALADPELSRGTTDGELGGVPIAVKDNLDTADFPTTGGTPALKASRPGRDHPAVARLRAAGAVVVGKTNLHELALGITSNNAGFGPVRNPHDPKRSAGGSSGGSAVAVAAGVVPYALGTDTGGSMRIPAAHCGVVGLRPTVGRWGTEQAVPISHTRDTPGGYAATVAGVSLLDRLVTGEEAAPALAGPQALRLGVPRAGFYAGLHPDVAASVERALAALSDAGAQLVEMEVTSAHELDGQCGLAIVFYELLRDLPAYLATLPGPERELTYADVVEQVASPDVRAAMEAAQDQPVSDEDYRGCLELREQLRQAYAAALRPAEGSRLDAVVYPTVPLPAPPLGDDLMTELNGESVPVFTTTIQNTGPGSTAGMPAISLPAAPAPNGLPIGLSLEALPGDDVHLLAVAEVVERVLAG
jgi:mandelamide amidase